MDYAGKVGRRLRASRPVSPAPPEKASIVTLAAAGIKKAYPLVKKIVRHQ
jgi:hypothetical protein